MYERLLHAPLIGQKSFFLFGCRGSGKTAWVKTQNPDALYLDLLETDLYAQLLAKPSRLELMIPPNFKEWVIIDEVQKIPELLNEVHRLIEKYQYKFILTGSSARGLRKQGVNLLAGRALTFYMHPLVVKELQEDFKLDFCLKFGCLPSVFSQADPMPYLKSYVNTHLRQEVLQEGLTRNIGAFSRFLEVASFSQGQVLNLSEIAREANIHRKVVENHFEILEDLLLSMRLPVFTKRAKRRLVAHPKFYFFDVGIFRALRPRGPLDSPEEAEGPALETLILQQLCAYNEYLQWGYEIYYWRSSTGQEVDFVLYGEKGFIGIEMKRSSNVSNKDFRGLLAFHEDYPEAKLYLLYGGTQREYHGPIEVIPFALFFANLESL